MCIRDRVNNELGTVLPVAETARAIRAARCPALLHCDAVQGFLKVPFTPEGLEMCIRDSLLYLIPYAVIGWDVLWRAVKNIRNGQVFDENFLMSIATIGAFGCGEYPEAVAVMLFYQAGELFQSVAVGRSRQSIAALMDIRPDYANMERDGQLVHVCLLYTSRSRRTPPPYPSRR